MNKILTFLALCLFCVPFASADESDQGVRFHRKYFEPLSYAEAQGIGFIVTTVSTKPAVMLLFEKGNLDRAGEQIVGVHPLRFWKEVFIRPELRMRIAKMWGLAKGQFMESFVESFEYMNSIGMFYDEYVEDFSSVSGIPKETLLGLAHRNQWSQMIYLIFQATKH